MARQRTENEQLADDAVLLSLWTLAQEYSPDKTVGDRIKAMKLTFLLGYDLYQDKVKGLNFEFYRYRRGPVANEVYASLQNYRDFDLIAEDEEIVITDEGRSLGHAFLDEVLRLPENKSIYDRIDYVAYEYGPLDQKELLGKVYEMKAYTIEHPGHGQTIANIPLNQHFTQLLENEEAKQILYIPRGWEMTLEMAFHPHALDNLKKGVADMRAGRVHEMEALLSHV